MSPLSARIVSCTWQNERVCVPSPWISRGSPASARPTKRGMTIPYWPLRRGPTVLKRRAMAAVEVRSWCREREELVHSPVRVEPSARVDGP